MEMLQEGFNEIDGVDPTKEAKAPASEPTVVTNIDPLGAKGKKKPEPEEAKDEEHTCTYCGKHDPSFTEETMDMHFFEDCPMLYNCPGCNQMLEIPDLNYHLEQECEMAQDYQTCPRCKEPIHVGEYDQHVDEELCNMASNPAKANRCPLCHEDVPPSEKGWKQHLLVDTCPNNPRHP